MGVMLMLNGVVLTEKLPINGCCKTFNLSGFCRIFISKYQNEIITEL